MPIRVLNPAAALMGRLTYARKFALIGFILVVPAAIALHAYWAQQSGQIAFSAKERVGMVYLKPANQLAVAVVQARSAAVEGKRPPSLDAALAAVDRADTSLGAELETTKDVPLMPPERYAAKQIKSLP